MISDVDSILVGHDLRQEATSLHTATLQVNDGKNTAVTWTNWLSGRVNSFFLLCYHNKKLFTNTMADIHK